MLNEIKRIKSEVRSLLEKKESNRDSDNKLIANIWHKQLGEIAKTISGMELLQLFSEGKLASPESIRRCRQKIQEQEPLLRGESYNARKNASQEVRTNINKI